MSFLACKVTHRSLRPAFKLRQVLWGAPASPSSAPHGCLVFTWGSCAFLLRAKGAPQHPGAEAPCHFRPNCVSKAETPWKGSWGTGMEGDRRHVCIPLAKPNSSLPARYRLHKNCPS